MPICAKSDITTKVHSFNIFYILVIFLDPETTVIDSFSIPKSRGLQNDVGSLTSLLSLLTHPSEAGGDTSLTLQRTSETER